MGPKGVEEMVPLEEVQRAVLASCSPLGPVELELGAAFGHVLAADVHAPGDLPPFANTAMDGFAVRSDDTAGAPVELEVIGVLAAGSTTAGPSSREPPFRS